MAKRKADPRNCALICRSCTRHDDAPLVLGEESVDHAAVGKAYHEQMGAVWAARERHLARNPDHEMIVHCEDPDGEDAAIWGQIAEHREEKRAALSRRAYERTLVRMAERLAQARPAPEGGA